MGSNRNLKISFYSSFLLFCVQITVCDGYNATMYSLIIENSTFPYDYSKVQPGIEIALEKVKRFLPDSIHLSYTNKAPSNDCTPDHIGSMSAFAKYRLGVNVFLGPACTIAVDYLGRMAAQWKIPVVTPLGLIEDDERRTVFTSLIRLSFNKKSLTEFLDAIMRTYHWNNSALISDEAYDFGRKIVDSIYKQFYDTNSWSCQKFGFDSRNQIEFKKTLLQAAGMARIFIVIASAQRVRDLMIAAKRLGMTTSDYIYITTDVSDNVDQSMKWEVEPDDGNNAVAREAFQSLFVISAMRPSAVEYIEFVEQVKNKSAELGHTFTANEEVHPFVGEFHDSVLLYGIALNKTYNNGPNELENTTVILSNIFNTTFEGVTGEVFINGDGDRAASYSLNNFNYTIGKFQQVVIYQSHKTRDEEKFNKSFTDIIWPGNNKKPPMNEPDCGYRHEKPKCNVEGIPVLGIVAIVLGCIISITVIVVFIVYRKLKLKAELNDMWWKIKWEDITIHQGGKGLGSTSLSRHSLSLKRVESMSALSNVDKQTFAPIGTLNGRTVAIRHIRAKKINITTEFLLELRNLRNLSHENLNRFVGLCIEEPKFCMLTEYCTKGSLQDILANEAMKLDWSFKYSLLNDLIQGMLYLHDSPLHSHGYLSSSNCVIDGRFVLKITDFALPALRAKEVANPEEEQINFKELLWRAPEHIRNQMPVNGTPKGDVYSFGIVLQEIILRAGPYETEGNNDEPKDIVEKVRTGGDKLYRPQVPKDAAAPELIILMVECWSEDPNNRPTFSGVRNSFRKLYKESGNILDNLLNRMERYANDLEALVEERTQAFFEEKKKAENLLYQVLPKSVADQLKLGKTVDPESFDCVTIYFSDIVGFATLSAESTPMQIVDFLNDIYTLFDGIIDSFDVYKVETIGDAYMVVSGLPIRNGNNHAREIARMCLTLLKAIGTFKIRHRPDDQVNLRIGINSGPCVAGVIGLKMPRYCLFGDTVNTASRMESNGLALKIHVSPSTKAILESFSTFELEERGEVEMKGKGKVLTYWLLGER